MIHPPSGLASLVIRLSCLKKAFKWSVSQKSCWGIASALFTPVNAVFHYPLCGYLCFFFLSYARKFGDLCHADTSPSFIKLKCIVLVVLQVVVSLCYSTVTYFSVVLAWKSTHQNLGKFFFPIQLFISMLHNCSLLQSIRTVETIALEYIVFSDGFSVRQTMWWSCLFPHTCLAYISRVLKYCVSTYYYTLVSYDSALVDK